MCGCVVDVVVSDVWDQPIIGIGFCSTGNHGLLCSAFALRGCGVPLRRTCLGAVPERMHGQRDLHGKPHLHVCERLGGV